MTNHQEISEAYWDSFEVSDSDIEILYNHLLEIESPQAPEELISAIVQQRIQAIKTAQQKEQEKKGDVYKPAGSYAAGQKLTFPSMEWKSGKVQSIHDGFNPEFPGLKVIDVLFEQGETHSFASNLLNHALNHVAEQSVTQQLLDQQCVIQQYGHQLQQKLDENLSHNKELIRIAGKWFPKALLVDINSGYLNLAEAVLEEMQGGPLPTTKLMEQIEFKTDTNQQLTEFSLNHALQEDGRFDEVGPTGEVLWFLNAFEPEEVRHLPVFLKSQVFDYDHQETNPLLVQFEGSVFDELEEWEKPSDPQQEVILSLIFPHWRAGTLPLSHSLEQFFPTAYESPRVKFNFHDIDNKVKFPGWVVREHRYVSGLKDWYSQCDLMPGSLIYLRKGEEPGEIIIQRKKSKQSREWMRTALIGSDLGIVFGMLKQNVVASFNERMAIAVPDPEPIDQLWLKESAKSGEINEVIEKVIFELMKLNPQIHAQELYAAVNVIRRCPPGCVIHFLLHSPRVKQLGDLYFQVIDSEGVG